MSLLSETCFRTTQEVLKNGHGHLEEFIQSLNDQISTLRRKINFLREELKEKDNVIKILKVNFLSHDGCSERLSSLSTVNLKSILFQIKRKTLMRGISSQKIILKTKILQFLKKGKLTEIFAVNSESRKT